MFKYNDFHKCHTPNSTVLSTFHCNVANIHGWCNSLTELALRWRHNGRDSVSNHQHHHCLLNRLFRRRSKQTSKLRVTGLWVRNSPGSGEFPAQMASNAESASIWWRHHGKSFDISQGNQLGYTCPDVGNCAYYRSPLCVMVFTNKIDNVFISFKDFILRTRHTWIANCMHDEKRRVL